MNSETMQHYSDDEVVDCVVIGTGAGGAPLLSSLARRGWRVLALEAGRHWQPAEHTPDEIEAAASLNWMEERLSGGSTPTAFGSNNSGIGVGGSTLHWGAFVPRPDRLDLQLRSGAGGSAQGVDWPIPYEELLHYIEQAEQVIGVSGPARYPWDPSRRYLLAPAKRNASADMMAASCGSLGIRTADAPAALVSRDWHQPEAALRQACNNCGACHQGCRNGSKASMDTTFLPVAVAHGAEIRSECRAVGIELDSASRIKAVIYRHNGRERRQRCRTLVLSAGGVETPRLLLHTGLANGSGQVGRNFMVHGATQVWGRFDREMLSYRGYPSSLITEDFRRPGDADFAGGYLIQSLGVMPLTWATGVVRGTPLWGEPLVKMIEGYRFMAGVGINAECLPSEHNRIALGDEIDAFGVPKAVASYSMGENERALDRHATQTMLRIVEQAGAHDTIVLPRTAHTIGTCRMGTDSESSVVDPDGRSHEIENLWVCDNSIFPSSLIANPALTIMALSLRTADRMISNQGFDRSGRNASINFVVP